ncbi:pyruvate decarboxylase-like protein [Rhizodiscina lignyota]|uniref:Pyruvate decarboxylase n=1 Tax=Rhizodiscina lignyota TaxID=1504668 RepID=A0A9P4MBC5_9PEZI|nr:pyruvate decarboxylase-like protein [Rhizodiscina lignyota]
MAVNGDAATITLGTYLFKRIRQLGVGTVLGVPGDFQLELLDYLYKVPNLRFVGNANELNAAYAADGYARVRGLPGVFVTTHGVGELSALNGVVGAKTEQVKVIHIVGQTPRFMQKNRLMIHHSLGFDPDHQIYNEMSRHARLTQAELHLFENDIPGAAREIDRVIRECMVRSGPVYIFIPLNMVHEELPASLLDTPIDLSLPVDIKAQTAAVEAIKTALQEAKKPAIFADALTHRHNAVPEARALAKRLQIPAFAANMGKGILDESDDFWVGIYHGQVNWPGVTDALESSDLILVLGSLPCDTNTGGFQRKFGTDKTIEINPNYVVVKGKQFPKTYIKPLLAELTKSLEGVEIAKVPIPQLPQRKIPRDHEASHLTQTWIWKEIASTFRPGDVVLGETGTASFGLVGERWPQDMTYIFQGYYGSIGYANPAALGADLALQDIADETEAPRRRTYLVIGDGSLNLTINEIGTMCTYGAKPVIVVVNNAGYTIERVIHGARQPYNDINPTAYDHLLPVFKHPDPENCFRRVVQKSEFAAAFDPSRIENNKHLQLIEVVLDKLDVPWQLLTHLKRRGEKQIKYMQEEGFKEQY